LYEAAIRVEMRIAASYNIDQHAAEDIKNFLFHFFYHHCRFGQQGGNGADSRECGRKRMLPSCNSCFILAINSSPFTRNSSE
jgi:hypothetical protein